MKDERWFDPVDPGSTAALDVLVDVARDAVPLIPGTHRP